MGYWEEANPGTILMGGASRNAGRATDPNLRLPPPLLTRAYFFLSTKANGGTEGKFLSPVTWDLLLWCHWSREQQSSFTTSASVVTDAY